MGLNPTTIPAITPNKGGFITCTAWHPSGSRSTQRRSQKGAAWGSHWAQGLSSITTPGTPGGGFIMCKTVECKQTKTQQYRNVEQTNTIKHASRQSVNMSIYQHHYLPTNPNTRIPRQNRMLVWCHCLLCGFHLDQRSSNMQCSMCSEFKNDTHRTEGPFESAPLSSDHDFGCDDFALQALHIGSSSWAGSPGFHSCTENTTSWLVSLHQHPISFFSFIFIYSYFIPFLMYIYQLQRWSSFTGSQQVCSLPWLQTDEKEREKRSREVEQKRRSTETRGRRDKEKQPKSYIPSWTAQDVHFLHHSHSMSWMQPVLFSAPQNLSGWLAGTGLAC